jgi:hypothetical protein
LRQKYTFPPKQPNAAGFFARRFGFVKSVKTFLVLLLTHFGAEVPFRRAETAFQNFEAPFLLSEVPRKKQRP